jgi:hypothetical protein
MEATSIDELREELTLLEAEEARLSAQRGRLHDQIDFGFGSDTTKEREREISDDRQGVHQRISSLKELIRKRQGV